jgi:hypothetical protein
VAYGTYRSGGRRRALLIGITETPSLRQVPDLAQRFPHLVCADRDVELIGKALEQSDYLVTAHHSGHPEQQNRNVGRGTLLGRLHDLFASCEPGDTAFVYVSCHGESVNGRDYLVPADAQPGDLRPDGSRGLLTGTLLGADPRDLLDGLKPGVTAAICLDMCRTASPRNPAETEQTLLVNGGEDVFWLHSCASGQQSFADPHEGSHFGRALAEALSPTSPPTTFGEIVEYTRKTARRLAKDLPFPPPEIQPFIPHQRREAADELPLCEGSQETLRWTKSLTESALWAHTSGSPAAHDRVKARLTGLVLKVAESRSGIGAHLDDPWGDPAHPVRVERYLTDLVRRSGLRDSEMLSPAETAVLLAAPVVYEGVVAVALGELSAIFGDRLDGDGSPQADGALCPSEHQRLVRSAVVDVCRSHARVQRMAEALRRRRLAEAALAADHWLRHRYIADWDRLWERTGDYPSIDALIEMTVDAVIASAEDPSAHTPTDAERHAIDRQVRQVLGHVTVRPGSSPRINEAHQDDDWNHYPPVPGSQWRGGDLAHLLWTAGLLAADPRRMSSVLIDHLTAHKPLVPREVIPVLSTGYAYDDTRFPAGDGAYGLAVRFRCPHPALHAAIEELVACADAAVRSLHRHWHKQGTSAPALLRGLPVEVTTEHLIPYEGEYTKPLERLRLAEDEIRPLLMGTQLYGDRTLAVRELYQNALDACRHRDMRVQYGVRRGRPDPGWRGSITFTQGWDEECRPYIQCEDNGTGMSREKLTSMFARAGKRYEQDPDFLQERRNWRRYGIDDVAMNSRFGIGVFSYFMLAEEVVVWTGAVDFHGKAMGQSALRADIHAGSNLLQIRPDANAPVNGGTRVRLYLTAHEEPLPSLVDTLNSLLWVSDYDVKAVELAEDDPGRTVRSSRWRPNELRSQRQWRDSRTSGEGTWIVQGPGRLLFDGVTIKDSPRKFGYVFNLREAHHPELSVNRNELLSYDEDRVMEALLASVGPALEGCVWASMNWLWRLTQAEPRLALRVLAELSGDTRCLLEVHDEEFQEERYTTYLLLADVGCLPFDGSVLSHGTGRVRAGSTLSAWRKSLLQAPEQEQQFLPEGYPTPSVLDFALFPEEQPVDGWKGLLPAAVSLRVPLHELLRALRRYAVVGAFVPATGDIRALRSLRLDALAVDLYDAYQHVSDYREDISPAVHAPLLLTASKHDVTLGHTLEVLRTLKAIDRRLPSLPQLEPALLGERFSTSDVELLIGSVDEDNDERDWHPGVVDAFELIQRTDDPASRVYLADRVRVLAPLGFSLAAEPSDETLNSPSLDRVQRELLSVDIDGVAPWYRGEVPLMHVVLCSAHHELTLDDVSNIIDETSEATGVRTPALPDGTGESTAPAWLRPVNYDPREPDRLIGPWEIICSLPDDEATFDNLDARLAEASEEIALLEACGVLTEGCRSQLEAIQPRLASIQAILFPAPHRGSATSRRSRLAYEVSGDFDREEVTPAYLLSLAMRGETTLGEVVARFAGLPEDLPLSVVALPDEAMALAPTPDLAQLLLGARNVQSRFRGRLTVRSLLLHCKSQRISLGTCVDMLAPYAVIGAPPVPGEFTGEDALAIRDLHPDMFDIAAFEDDLLGSEPLDPLRLVLVAGRFGWTLEKAYARFAPFRCLGLDVTVREPTPEEADLVPDWRDVIVLTEELTGRAPALSGPVDPDHIALCAEETDLSEAEVRERFARYSALFSLVVPSTEVQDR